MKTAAMVLAAFSVVLGDVTPRSSSFNPRRLVEVRSFLAPGAWMFAPGGKYIATSEGGDSFGLIETATGKTYAKVGDHNGVVRHDGNWGQSDKVLATTAGNGSVRVWDATTQKMLLDFTPHGGYT